MALVKVAAFSFDFSGEICRTPRDRAAGRREENRLVCNRQPRQIHHENKEVDFGALERYEREIRNSSGGKHGMLKHFRRAERWHAPRV